MPNFNYARIYAPGGGILFYPVKSIKVDEENSERLYFSRPEGTELLINYSNRKENVPDTAPSSERFENTTRTVKIEDLKKMYQEERKAYMENNGFANMTVPTSWGSHFKSEGGRPFVSISIPIPENEEDVYYSFIVQEDKFKASQKQKE